MTNFKSAKHVYKMIFPKTLPEFAVLYTNRRCVPLHDKNYTMKLYQSYSRPAYTKACVDETRTKQCCAVDIVHSCQLTGSLIHEIPHSVTGGRITTCVLSHKIIVRLNKQKRYHQTMQTLGEIL